MNIRAMLVKAIDNTPKGSSVAGNPLVLSLYIGNEIYVIVCIKENGGLVYVVCYSVYLK
jgi:hypothetical protein